MSEPDPQQVARSLELINVYNALPWWRWWQRGRLEREILQLLSSIYRER